VGSAGIGVLGPLTVDGNAAGLAPRDRVVLAALAVRPGEVVSAERLADALWGEQPPVSWHKVVPGCVMRLRRVIGVDAIETVPEGYRLVVPGDEVDARRFERLVVRARELLTLGEPERAAHLAGEALGLWRGRPLGELEHWGEGRIEAARLEELRRDAEELHLDAALRAGRYREVLGAAQARVAEAPLRERRWALLAIAQYQAGRQGEALRTLHRARTVLGKELGVDPGPGLVALEHAILRQDPSLIADEARPEPATTCPYLGLVPYDVGDADGFFGRDIDVTECLRRLTTVGVLFVVGPSGSGKSSLVRAGVAAALVREGHRVAIVTPGPHPMDALTTVTYDAGPLPVLVVDQCEQAVSLCGDSAERSRFFEELARRAIRAPLVVALRADRLGDVTAQPEFARLVERGLHLLGAMADADLRAAIEGPARQAGLLLEAGLVDLLVREVEGEPGALPHLSHALRETWERREGRTLTVAGYQATGGIRGAVARSAEELYEQVPPDQRDVLRDLLLRLVEPSVDGEPVAVPVARRTLLHDPDHDHLVDLLVDGRLVTSDDGFIGLSHECLARAWPRLRGWLDDDVEGQRMLRHLSGAADAWDSMGRPDAELYRGIRLDRAVEWRQLSQPILTATERAFLDDSGSHAEAEASRHRRTKRFRRAVMVGVALLVVTAGVAGLLAVRSAERADDARAAAELARAAADARRAAALSRTANSIDSALLLAVEAVRLDDSPETRESLLAALARGPALIGAARGGGIGATELSTQPFVAASPAGDVVLAGDGATTAARDAHTLRTLHEFGEPLAQVEYRADGTQVAVVAQAALPGEGPNMTRGPVRLLDAATLEPSTVQLGGGAAGPSVPLAPASPVVALDFDYSADGSHLAADLCVFRDFNMWDFECAVVVWDLAAPQRPVLSIGVGRAWGVALSPDHGLLYVGTYEPALDVYDVATGALLRSRALGPELAPRGAASQHPGETLEVSPDGATVAVNGAIDVMLLDAATLTDRRLVGHTGLVQAVQFSHDGTRLASGSDDSTIIVWDVATASKVEQLTGHTGPVRSVAFAPDDTTLYSAGEDRQLLVWDLRGDRRSIPRIASFPGPDPSGSSVVPAVVASPAPDGESVVQFEMGGNFGGTFRFLDLATGRLGEEIVTGHANVPYSWRPPGFDDLATADLEGFVHIWDRRRGTLLAERQVTAEGIGIAALAYTQDGSMIVGIDGSASIFRVDADTLEPIGGPIALDGGGGLGLDVTTASLTVGPDGRTGVALVMGASSAVVDLAEGRIVRPADLAVEPGRAEISPDGRRLAVVTNSGDVGLTELETGEWIRPPTPAHTEPVWQATWAPDGSFFISSGRDGRIRLWDGRTGEPLGTILPGPPDSWGLTQVLPDGHTLLIATTANEVFTWDTRLEAWIERACDLAGRNLTTDEWREAFDDRPYRDTCPK
jgi:WD40 repeat protein/DNA-binding SARP family transcriptional activator